MENIERWLLPLFVFGWIAGLSGTAWPQVNPQIQKDIQQRLAHLQKTKADLDAAQAELATAKKNLAAAKTFDQTEKIRSWMDKVQSSIQDSTVKILDDINYLRVQWTLLTPEQQSFVDSVQKNLGS